MIQFSKHLSCSFLLLLLPLSVIQAQWAPRPITLQADSLMQNGKFKEALKAYQEGYRQDPKDPFHLEQLVFALGRTGQVDSCFKYLAIKTRNDTSAAYFAEGAFYYLLDDPRWKTYQDEMITRINHKMGNPYKDLEYARTLWRMQVLDQAFYPEDQVAQQQFGFDNPVSNAIWELKERLNKENQAALLELIEKKGWPRKSQVGGIAAGAAFLIIQHSDTQKQMRFLPEIKKLCEQNEANWPEYALMYDRTELAQGRPQRYGSQLNFNPMTNQYELSNLEDPAKVDLWRAEVGLGPLADYLANWGLKWEAPK